MPWVILIFSWLGLLASIHYFYGAGPTIVTFFSVIYGSNCLIYILRKVKEL